MKSSWFVGVALVVLVGGAVLYRGSGPYEFRAVQAPSAESVGQSATSSAETPSTRNGGMPSTAVLVKSEHESLGTYLAAQNGRALYFFSKDKEGESNCVGSCGLSWPRYTPIAGQVLEAEEGITGALATIRHSDGSAQLTYKGRPLYYYSKDTAPGDVRGDGVNGVWFVAKP